MEYTRGVGNLVPFLPDPDSARNRKPENSKNNLDPDSNYFRVFVHFCPNLNTNVSTCKVFFYRIRKFCSIFRSVLILILIQMCQLIDLCSKFKSFFVNKRVLCRISTQMCQQCVKFCSNFRSANCSIFQCSFASFVLLSWLFSFFFWKNSWAYFMHNIIYYSAEHVHVCRKSSQKGLRNRLKRYKNKFEKCSKKNKCMTKNARKGTKVSWKMLKKEKGIMKNAWKETKGKSLLRIPKTVLFQKSRTHL